jgi:hypothetical protein
MGRADQLRSMFSPVGKGLEIGPSHNPLMPKAAGFNVEVLDYLDAKGLRQKYSEAGLDVSTVEEVDFISDGRIAQAGWVAGVGCARQALLS